MNNVGKIAPALIDAKLLKRIVQTTNTQHIASKSIFMNEFEKIGMSILTTIKIYWFYIFIFGFIIGYIWYCYIQHAEKKKLIKRNLEEQIINKPLEQFVPGDYVCDNGQVQILQRPIPEYRHNDVNKKIRTMYLEELNPLPRYPPFQDRSCNRKSNSNALPKIHRGIPATIYETPLNPLESRNTTYLDQGRQQALRKLPMTRKTEYTPCHRQPVIKNEMDNIYGQPMYPMTSISNNSTKCNDSINEYGDTFYDAPIKRENGNDDGNDTDEFDNQFYENY